jgi:hypothetical protein
MAKEMGRTPKRDLGFPCVQSGIADQVCGFCG